MFSYCFLVRRYAPTFTIRPDPVNHVMSGNSLNLTCVAVGSPMPYVFWTKIGAERLGDPDNTPIGKNVLQLTNIQDSANYSCTAVSDLGTILLSTEVRVQGMAANSNRDCLKMHFLRSFQLFGQWNLGTMLIQMTNQNQIILLRVFCSWIFVEGETIPL